MFLIPQNMRIRAKYRSGRLRKGIKTHKEPEELKYLIAPAQERADTHCLLHGSLIMYSFHLSSNTLMMDRPKALFQAT